jgi:hypothetical protein
LPDALRDGRPAAALDLLARHRLARGELPANRAEAAAALRDWLKPSVPSSAISHERRRAFLSFPPQPWHPRDRARDARLALPALWPRWPKRSATVDRHGPGRPGAPRGVPAVNAASRKELLVGY